MKKNLTHLKPLLIPHAVVYIKKVSMSTYWYDKQVGELKLVIEEGNNSEDYTVVKYSPKTGKLRKTMYLLLKDDCVMMSRVV